MARANAPLPLAAFLVGLTAFIDAVRLVSLVLAGPEAPIAVAPRLMSMLGLEVFAGLALLAGMGEEPRPLLAALSAAAASLLHFDSWVAGSLADLLLGLASAAGAVASAAAGLGGRR